ncbi:MAG TPA: TonB-dependent receptor [Luteitalea sp.]|nr:TonB-dependent receptor [Luteitalea sp.]
MSAALPIAAQPPSGGVAGVVADQSGASVTRAAVELQASTGQVRSTVTDAEGRYRFDAVSVGVYTVRVTATGFQRSERRVTLSTAERVTADVQLSVQPLEQSVTVSAEGVKAAVEAQRALTPGGVTVVDGEQLYQRHMSGMADMLRYVPGVWSESSYGSEELFFSSRGSNLDATDYDKNGIKLLQDGLPVTTADGNNHNRVIDPLTARYASAARGANALTYGASTLGGAIDFTSPTARNSAPVSVFLDGGSYGALNGRATFGAAWKSVDGLLTVEGRNWDGYRAHSSQERLGLYGNAGWQPSTALRLQLFGTYVNNDQRLPGALTRDEAALDPNQASAAALSGDYGKVVKTGRVAGKANWSLGANGFLEAGVSYEGQSLFHPIVNQVFVDFDGPGPNAPVEVFSLLIDTDHRDLGAMVRYNRSVGRHDLVAGLNYGDGSVQGGNYRNLNGRPNGISEYVDNMADSLEAFVVDRWRASSRVTAVFGGQVVSAARDVRTTNALSGALSHPNARFSSFNPRAGLIASLNDAGEIYGNVSRLYEAPTTFELQNDIRGGDATLDPMSGTVAEIGWRSRAGQASGTTWNWDITAYYARINDEILSTDDPAAPGNSLTLNVDRTTHAGVEALVGASVDLGRHRIDPQVSLTFNKFHFATDRVYGDNRLPAAPRYAARGEVLYRHAGGFYAGPTFDLVGQRYADFANTYVVDGYGLMGLRAGLAGRRWEVFGDLRNLFDKEYVATLSVLNIAGPSARVLNPGAPVTVYAGLRLSF